MTIGPDATAIARLTVATSSPSDVRGSCTAVTEWPLAARSGITFAQLDPSPKRRALKLHLVSSPCRLHLTVSDCLAPAWPRRILTFITGTYVGIATYSAIEGARTEFDKAVTRRRRIQSYTKHLLTAMHAVAEKVASTTWRDEPASA